MTIKNQLLKLKENWLLLSLVIIVLVVFSGITSNFSPITSDYGYEKNAMPSSRSFGEAIVDGIMPPVYQEDFAPEVQKRAITKTASLSTEIKRNTFKEVDSKVKDLVKGFNFIPINLRLYVDFLKKIKSGIDGTAVYDGSGNQITKEKLLALWNEITEVRNQYRSEWFDNRFSKKKRKLQMSYHQIQPDGSLKEVTEDLEDCLMSDKIPGIDLHDWLNRANKQGLPPAGIKKGELYYWPPQDGRVPRFGTDADWAELDCVVGPSDSDASLGVRVAKNFV
jgi:hypothetical protein